MEEKQAMHKRMRNKRGISPIIATLLLIAIAVAAAVVTYSWVMSMIGTESASAETSIKIDFVQFVSTTEVDVTVRNAGAVPLSMSKIYITNENGTLQTLALGAKSTPFFNGTTSVPIGQTEILRCFINDTAAKYSNYFAFVEGSLPYQIELMSNTGIYVTGTYYTPASLSTD
jgi:flagellin-like protein